MTQGIEFRDASGALLLQTTEALPRLIHSQRFAHDFSGTLHVPEFDSGHGMFYVSPCIGRWRLSLGNWSRLTDYDPNDRSGFLEFSGRILPDISWEPSTRIMTIAPAQLPAGWPELSGYDYYLNFLNLKRRIEVTA